MLKELVEKNRSYRKFYQEKEITREELESFIDLARKTPSATNGQLTRYLLSNNAEQNAQIYSCLKWAAYYKDWDGPEEGERPSAYIILLAPQSANVMYDEGIKGQTILLAAVEKGMGGCFIGNVDREALAQKVAVPAGYKITLVLALGYPKECVILHDVDAGTDLKYYRDAQGNQNVPKLRLKDLIF
jgi:nitroreductase